MDSRILLAKWNLNLMYEKYIQIVYEKYIQIVTEWYRFFGNRMVEITQRLYALIARLTQYPTCHTPGNETCRPHHVVFAVEGRIGFGWKQRKQTGYRIRTETKKVLERK